MITNNELGLSQQDYDNLLNARVKPTYKVLISRYYPDFFRVDRDSSIETTHYYGAAVGTPGVMRAVKGNVYFTSNDGTSWTTHNGAYTEGVPPEVIWDGNQFVLFYVASGKLYKKTSANGSSLSIATEIGSVPNGTYFIAASDATTVHIASRSQSNKWNTRLYCYRNTTLYTSEIYWAHIITGLGVAKNNNGNDVIVISSNLPPLISMRTQGSQVELISYRANGLVSFIYDRELNTWSDHYIIENFDDSNLWMRRSNVRVNNINGYIIATAYASDGTSEHKTDQIQLYRSKDGRWWEQGHPYVNSDMLRGASIGIKDNYVYLVNEKSVYKSYQTDFVGNIAPEIESDISDMIIELNRSTGQISQTTCLISNQNNQLYNDTVLETEGIFQIRYYIGYVTGGKPVQHLLGIEEIDYIKTPESLPTHMVELNSRDHGSWFSDKKAHHVLERETGIVGPDDFRDDSKTGFGGLRHTAVQAGHWRTEEGELLLASNNDRAMALNTYDMDIWNGSQEFMFLLPNPPLNSPDDLQSYSENIFRAYDKDNYNFIRARKDHLGNHIEIGQVRGGNETIWATSTSLVPNYDTWYGLKVVVHYQKVRGFWSSDGRIWQSIVFNGSNEWIIDSSSQGQNPQVWSPNSSFSVMVERGSFGYAGWGYSEIDDWGLWNNWEKPELPPLLPPSINPSFPFNGNCDDYDWDYVDPGDGPETCLKQDYAIGTVFVMDKNKLYRTREFTRANPIWEVIAENNLQDFTIDPFSPSIRGLGQQINIYLLKDDGIYFSNNAHADVPTWTKVRNLNNVHTIIRTLEGEEGGVAAYCPIIENVSSGTETKTINVTFDGYGYEDNYIKITVPTQIWDKVGNGFYMTEEKEDENEWIKIELKETTIQINNINVQYYTGDKLGYGSNRGRRSSYGASGNLLQYQKVWEQTVGPGVIDPLDSWLNGNIVGGSYAGNLPTGTRIINFDAPYPRLKNKGGIRNLSYTGTFTVQQADAAMVTYYNRISNEFHQSEFGFSDNQSSGMDVDKTGEGMIYAAANGIIYSTRNQIDDTYAYDNEMTEVVTSESFASYRIGALRIFDKGFDGFKIEYPWVHGALLYNLYPPSIEPNAPSSFNGRWTEADWQNQKGFSDNEFATDFNYGMLRAAVNPDQDYYETMVIPAGPHALDYYRDNPKVLIWTGYYSGQQEELPENRDYFQVLTTINWEPKEEGQEESSGDYKIEYIGDLKLDAVFMSPKSRNNIYGCGKDGVWFTSSRGWKNIVFNFEILPVSERERNIDKTSTRDTWQNKTGNITDLNNGNIPLLKKIEPVIRRL